MKNYKNLLAIVLAGFLLVVLCGFIYLQTSKKRLDEKDIQKTIQASQISQDIPKPSAPMLIPLIPN